MSSELKHLLQDAEMEINNLRRRSEILQAKVDTMDLFGVMLFTNPQRTSVGLGPDVAWALRKKITEIETGETCAKVDVAPLKREA